MALSKKFYDNTCTQVLLWPICIVCCFSNNNLMKATKILMFVKHNAPPPTATKSATTNFSMNVKAKVTRLLVPYRWNRTGGDYRFPRRLSFCPSVLLSVRQSVSPLGVRPLGFPNFSQSSFEILTWNLVYGFVLT